VWRRRVLSATLLPVPNDEALEIFWKYRDEIWEGMHKADTIEKKRGVVDALNVMVSVRGVDGKPKAMLHWWGMDTPLFLEDDTSGEHTSGSDSDPQPSLGGPKKGGGDIPILRAKRHIRSPRGLA
jgi:hypothetical protein